MSLRAGWGRIRGPVWVLAATVVLGASGYIFLTVTGARVPGPEYASLASLYLLIALIGPALFLPIEQETARLVSRARALGEGTRGLVGQMARLMLGGLLVPALALPMLATLLVDRVFNHHTGLLLALAVSVAGYGGSSLLRGVYAGQGRLRPYAVVVGVDGLARLVPCVGLAVAGVDTVEPYGLALGFGSVLAVAAGLVWFSPGTRGPGEAWRTLLAATGWLTAGSALTFALANIAPVVVTALLPGDAIGAGVFAFVFVVARVPVFALWSLQAILLPELSRAAAQRDIRALRRGIRQALVVIGVLAIGALIATAPVCRWLLDLLFDHGRSLSVATLTALAVGTILAMVVQVLQPALIAVGGHRIVAGAWLAGAVAFTAAFALPIHPVTAATAAQSVAGLATAVVMATALRRRLRSAGAQPREADRH